jgi:hypothetical protein
MLDSQLDKVEAFYLSREEAMMDRGEMLKAQLRELDDHRRLFLVGCLWRTVTCF